MVLILLIVKSLSAWHFTEKYGVCFFVKLCTTGLLKIFDTSRCPVAQLPHCPVALLPLTQSPISFLFTRVRYYWRSTLRFHQHWLYDVKFGSSYIWRVSCNGTSPDILLSWICVGRKLGYFSILKKSLRAEGPRFFWLLTLRLNTSEPGSVGIGGGVVQPPLRNHICSWPPKLCFAPVLDLDGTSTSETNFGACAWRHHDGTIVLAAKQRNPILGVQNNFLWKMTTAIEFYAQKLT